MFMTFALVVGTTGVSATVEDEGCTPGYWKQPHHVDSWPAGIDPDDPFSDYFSNFPGMTLMEVLWQGGGGKKALGRHIVAAYLNSYQVGYPLFPWAVVDAWDWAAGVDKKWAYTNMKNVIEPFNELGCPLN